MSQNQKKYIADIVLGEDVKLDDDLVHLLCNLQEVIVRSLNATLPPHVQFENLPLQELDAVFDALIPKLNEGLTLVGQFKEINDETQNLPTESETGLTNEEARNAVETAIRMSKGNKSRKWEITAPRVISRWPSPKSGESRA